MPAAVIPIARSIGSKRSGNWSLISIAQPGKAPAPFGILFFDEADDRLTFRLREADGIAGPGGGELDEPEADIFAALADDLALKGREMGGRALVEFLKYGFAFLPHRGTDGGSICGSGRGCCRPAFRRARAGQRSGYRCRAGDSVRYASSALQLAGGGYEVRRIDGERAGRLGAGAREAAAYRRHVCGARGGPVDGAAHSRWQPVRLPCAGYRVAGRGGWCWWNSSMRRTSRRATR